MTNLKSFDEQELQEKVTECRNAITTAIQTGTFETDTELEECCDAIDTGVSAVIELTKRGYATAEQEHALYDYLNKHGLID